jgi:hypothetical protein
MIIGKNKTKERKTVCAIDQKIGFECRTPILSMLEEIPHIKATPSIIKQPFSLSKALIGSKNPLRFSVTFSKYAPKTTNSMPIKPNLDGNSPVMKGAVNTINKGVKATNGTTDERDEVFIDFIKSMEASESILPPMSKAM